MNKAFCSAALAFEPGYKDDKDLQIAYFQWLSQTNMLLREADNAKYKRQWRKALTLLAKAQKLTKDFHLSLKRQR